MSGSLKTHSQFVIDKEKCEIDWKLKDQFTRAAGETNGKKTCHVSSTSVKVTPYFIFQQNVNKMLNLILTGNIVAFEQLELKSGVIRSSIPCINRLYLDACIHHYLVYINP